MHITARLNITTDPLVNNHLAVCNVASLVISVFFLASVWFMPGFRLVQYGLSDHTAAKHRRLFCSKVQWMMSCSSTIWLGHRASWTLDLSHRFCCSDCDRASSASVCSSSLTVRDLSPTLWSVVAVEDPSVAEVIQVRCSRA